SDQNLFHFVSLVDQRSSIQEAELSLTPCRSQTPRLQEIGGSGQRRRFDWCRHATPIRADPADWLFSHKGKRLGMRGWLGYIPQETPIAGWMDWMNSFKRIAVIAALAALAGCGSQGTREEAEAESMRYAGIEDP